MRNRLWIIILLIVWIGQWAVSIAGPLPTPGTPCWEGWLSVEPLADLVIYQANQQWPCPSPRSHPRRRGRRRRGQRGKKRPSRPRAVPTGKNEEDTEPKQTSAGSQGSSYDTVFAPQRWGLSPELSQELSERLYGFGQRYADCFKTRTRNTSGYAYHYLSGLLRLETKRNYTNIGRATGVAAENVQHFMSNSPWPARTSLDQVIQEIKATPGLERGSMLILDESANQSGDQKAGAGRQYNGRLGKVEMSQVGTFLGYANTIHATRPMWTWVDGELYLQEHWFTPERAEARQRVGIPPERRFQTKIQLGWKMIQHVQARGLPFAAVACDDVYGQSTWLRDELEEAEIPYIADVPYTTQVYLEKPVLGVPEPVPGQRGRKPTRLCVLNDVKPLQAHQVARHADTHWQRVRVRAIERGELNDPFAARRVWTLREGKPEPVQEWLVMRQEGKKRTTYALSNVPADTSLEYLAWLKCQRYFVERAIQDAKSEVGWDELQARKYRGWEHHLALVILAVWFLAQTRWEWAERCARDPTLAQQFELEVLPALSMANLRVLLRAAMPLPQPTPEEAVSLIVEHFVNRTRSRKSRLKRQRATSNAPP
ncbi:MAG: IS701 family transposase [Chloroflexi bacterium]|nr:IS701 family transposase [Chloroflexota bacterium]